MGDLKASTTTLLAVILCPNPDILIHCSLDCSTPEPAAQLVLSLPEYRNLKSSSLSRVWVFVSHGLQPARLLCPWNPPGKDIGMGCHFLLQGNLPDPGIEPGVSYIAGRFFTFWTARDLGLKLHYYCYLWRALFIHINLINSILISWFLLVSQLFGSKAIYKIVPLTNPLLNNTFWIAVLKIKFLV